MKRIAVTMLLIGLAAPAFAQGGIVEILPSVKPLPDLTPPPAPDGKVTGLNATAYDTLAANRLRNPRGFSDADATSLKAAMLKDGKLDEAETDLLREFVQDRTRSIFVRRQGAAADAPAVMVFSLAGMPKKIMVDTLYPAEELAAHWDKGAAGWKAIIAAARSDPRRAQQAIDLVTKKLGDVWAQSNIDNKYKPFSDLISTLYSRSTPAGADPDNVDAGRILAFRGARTLDINEQDKVPDFLYNWLKPKPPGS